MMPNDESHASRGPSSFVLNEARLLFDRNREGIDFVSVISGHRPPSSQASVVLTGLILSLPDAIARLALLSLQQHL
jgi:hypothetical protein